MKKMVLALILVSIVFSTFNAHACPFHSKSKAADSLDASNASAASKAAS